MIYALIQDGAVVNVIVATPQTIGEFPGTWVELTAGGLGWLYDGSTFTAPPPAEPVYRKLLTGTEWVLTFTDAEWAWLKTQRALTTAAGKQLDKFMDAIRWTNSIDVASPTVDTFYSWLLTNNIPGGQTRIDELRAGVLA